MKQTRLIASTLPSSNNYRRRGRLAASRLDSADRPSAAAGRQQRITKVLAIDEWNGETAKPTFSTRDHSKGHCYCNLAILSRRVYAGRNLRQLGFELCGFRGHVDVDATDDFVGRDAWAAVIVAVGAIVDFDH